MHDLILTWVLLHEKQTMVYVSIEQVQEWTRDNIDWGRIAIENMRRDTGENPATHEKRDQSGNLQWVAMMQADGLGSSRVLMAEELNRLFPDGYLLAIPERSVGMAVSVNATAEHRDSFMSVVRKCQRDGITEMLDKLLTPTDVLPTRGSSCLEG
ncbi:MAG TPA: hypothetical protein VE177_07860 [Candidatus Binatus sp.]|nr:hypothetical protein [Candidatus Binatus sp.]